MSGQRRSGGGEGVLRGTALAVLAAGLTMVAVGVRPAAADPVVALIPLADGCEVTATGTEVDEVVLTVNDGFSSRTLATGPTMAAAAWGDYYATAGQQLTFHARGMVAGQEVATQQLQLSPTCDPGGTITFTPVVTGTPPPGAVVRLKVLTCGVPNPSPPAVRVPVDAPVELHVVPGVERCFAFGSIPVGLAITGLEPPQVLPDPDAGIDVRMAFDSTNVSFEAAFRTEDGTLVDGTGLPDVDLATASFHARSVDVPNSFTEERDCAPGTLPEWDCTGSLRMYDAGSVEITDTAVPGWALDDSTFDAGDCVDVDGTCRMALVFHRVATAPPPVEPTPAPTPAPEPTPVPVEPAAAPTTTAATAATTAPSVAAAGTGPVAALPRTGRTSGPLAALGAACTLLGATALGGRRRLLARAQG